MSLLNSHSNSTNKVTHTALDVRYEAGDFTWGALPGGLTSPREVHRYATKSYSYVGMTLAAAKTCAAAKRNKYTRTRKYWTFETDHFVYHAATRCQADISVVHDDGDCYHVDINVNEDDMVCLIGSLPSDLKTLFNLDDVHYDEGDTEDQS